MSLKEKMDKLKRVLSGQGDDDEQNIVTQVTADSVDKSHHVPSPNCWM